MRLDKFLKVSRVIKRRTVAKDVSDAGRVMLNGRVAKAASEVKPGDIVEIGFGPKKMTIEITDIKETVPANEAKELYRVIGQPGKE